MADAVTITEAPGSRYTWASAAFSWSSASAGKNWSSAYPAVYTVAVAVAMVWAQASRRQPIKRAREAVAFADKPRQQHALRKSESISFAETYSDLIAYVLRWVEAIGIAEVSNKRHSKALKETLQATDYLARATGKTASEALHVAEVSQKAGTKRVAESLPLADGLTRGVGKSAAEEFGLSDRHLARLAKRIAEAVAIAETYTDLIAFILRIGEGIGFNDTGAKRLSKPITESFITSDNALHRSIKRVAEAVAVAEAWGRTVGYRRWITEGLALADALKRAMRLTATEALALAEQYRRHANGVISDMIVASTDITEQDFAAIVEAGHPPGYTDFRDFIPGDYTYRRALFRAILNSRNSDRGYIDALRLTVDVPDIFDRGTAQITDPTAGVVINFTRRFRVAPEVTMTHKGGTAVAIPRLLGAVTTTGFTAVLQDINGVCLSGAFTWIAQGY
jgi:hypothetical protein